MKEENKNEFDLLPIKKEETLAAEIVKSYFEEKEDEVHLLDYIEVLNRRKWIAIVFLITVVLTVTMGSFLAKPVFKAKTTIQISKENPNVLTFKDVYQVERQEEDYYQTQYNVLKSRTLAKRVIEKLELDKENEFNSLIVKYRKKPAAQRQIENIIIESFFDRLDVSPVKRSQHVEVSFMSHSPELSAKVANAIAEEYIEFTLDNKLTATQQARRWLEKQIEELKIKLEESEEKRNEYVEQKQIIFLDQEKDYKSLLTQKLSELSTEYSKASADLIQKESLYRKLQEEGADTIGLDNLLIQDLMKEYARLESEYNELSSLYNKDYPRMVRLKDKINKVNERIGFERGRLVSGAEAAYKTAIEREKNLSSSIETIRKEVVDFQKNMVQYQILNREVETNRELYNSLLQRVKEVGVSASLSTSNVLILDKADVPIEPYKPKKLLNIVLSVIIGLMGGVFLVFSREYLDKTIKSVDDIEKKIRLPLLGIVPVSETKKAYSFLVDPENDRSLAEAFRSIATYIQFSYVSRPPKRILITSPLEQEGKTTISINTSVSLVKLMGRGVIVDADLRKPKINNHFSMDNGNGLSSYLSGLIERDDLIRHTAFDGLDVITSGPVSPNPSDLLGSARMKELVDYLDGYYDFIIFDSPPVLGMSDSIILSTFMDGVIVVVRSGNTPKEALIQTKKNLLSVNAKVLGAVLNGVDYKTSYSYYSYYYSHYSNDKESSKNKLP